MKNIIIIYPSKKTALQLRDVLVGNGFSVSHICALGSTALGIAQDMRSGVIITASILPDMSCKSLAEHLPADFDIISLSKGGIENYGSGVINLPLPLNRTEFLQTVAVLVSSVSSFTRRKSEDRDLITDAKLILMKNRHISESQAHRFLQKESMRTGKSMKELSREIVDSFT